MQNTRKKMEEELSIKRTGNKNEFDIVNEDEVRMEEELEML